jgi:predicted ester cyclase
LLVDAPVGSPQRIGRKGARAWAATYFKAFPDAKWIKERVFGQDNRFVVEMVFSGTQAGSFEGAMRIPPTNKAVHVPAAIVGTAQEGRIQSFRFIWDQQELLGQLGLRPRKS